MNRVSAACLGLSLALFSGQLVGQISLPYETDFEVVDGYNDGVAPGQSPWIVGNSGALVTLADFASDAQGVEFPLGSSGFLTASFPGSTVSAVTFVDFYLKPVAGPFESLPLSASDVTSAMSGLVDDEGTGWLYVVHGDGQGSGQWQRVPHEFSLTADGVSTSWVRFTYRLNYTTKTWDLYLDNKLVATDLRFLDDLLDAFTQFRLKGGGLAPVYFDFFYAGYENPVFLDSDSDGMSDAYETANGLDLYADDRDLDSDFDGVVNIQEFLRDLHAGDPDSDDDGVPDGWELASGADPLSHDEYDLGSLPFFDDFENHSQQGITSSSGWQYSGDIEPVITIDEVYSGNFSAKIAGGTGPVQLYNLFSAEAQQVVWVDFRIVTGALRGVPALKSSTSAGFYFDEDGQLNAFDGSALPLGEWQMLEHKAVDDTWQRITVELDYARQVWSLYLNGVKVANDFGFANPVPYFTSFGFLEERSAISYLDQVSIGYSEPDNLDNDGDGLSNSEEDINGNGIVDATETDPNLWDTDGDGLSDGSSATLYIWLIADSGIVLDGSDGVESWRNRVSYGTDLAQSTITVRPEFVTDAIGGKSAVRFDGVDDFLEGDAAFDAGADDFTIILVHRRLGGHDKAAPVSFSVLPGTTGSPLLRYGPEAGQFGINAVGAGTNGTYVDLGSEYENQIYISSVSRTGGVYGSGGSLRLRSLTNGETHIAEGVQDWISGSNTGLFLGKKAYGTTHYFGGDIAEVRVYKGSLEEDTIIQMERKLATEYGLSLDQDSDGLPDDWERSIFGSLDEDALGDPDEDGLNNWREYNLSTDASTFDGFNFIVKKPSLELWLDGAQGIETDSLDNVVSWFDSSGNGNTAIQYDDGRRPLAVPWGTSGQQIVRFDGVDDYLFGDSNFDPGTGDFTLIAVTAQRLENGLSATLSYSTSDDAIGSPLLRWNRPESGDFGINEVGASTSGAFVSLAEEQLNDLKIVSARRVGGIAQGLNGILKIRALGERYTLHSEAPQTWSSGFSEAYYVGRKKFSDADNNDYFAGDVVEIFAFSEALSDTELRELEEYLGNKYSINLDVDADGLPDEIERQYFTDLDQGADDDYDLDGLSNIRELNLGMDPSNRDELGPVLSEASLVAWFDAETGLERDEQDKIYQWEDKSGFVHRLRQDSTTARPALDESSLHLPSVFFDGTDDYLDGDLGFDPSLHDFTAFVVHQRHGGHDKAAVFSFNQGTNITGAPLLRWGPNANELGINNVGVNADGAYLTFDADYLNRFLVTSVSREGGSDGGLNGVIHIASEGYIGAFSNQVTQSWESGSSTILALGKKSSDSSHFLGGNIAELIVFSGSLSIESKSRIHRYLVQKYALSSDIDGDGLSNLEEDANGNSIVDIDETDPLNADTDGDGVVDGLEELFGLNPLVPDAQRRPDADSNGLIEWKVEFEVSEGYFVGDIDTQNGWLAESSATVTNLTAGSGEQSLSIAGEYALAFIYAGWFDVPNLWVSFQADLLPTEVPESITPQQPTSAVFALGANRKLVAWNNELGEWESDTYNTIEEGWQNYSINLNYSEKKWNLILNGKMVFWGLPFHNPDVPHFSRFLVKNLPDTKDESATYVDTLLVSNREPAGFDFDGDGMPNDFERLYEFLDELDPVDGDEDYDGDGLVNSLEYLNGTFIDVEDTDSDNLSDYFEVYYGLNPLDPSDVSLDSDGDGMPDWWELGNSLQRYVADADVDTDADGLSNVEEFFWQTDPNSIDTDIDGWSDAFEVTQNFDPNSADSRPRDNDLDGVSNNEESNAGTNINLSSSYLPSRIAQYVFNGSLIGEGGETPTVYKGYGFVSGFSNQGILLNENDELEFNSVASLSRLEGSLSFWYKPSWESGTVVTSKIWRSLFEIGNWKAKYTPAYLGLVVHRETKLLGIRQHDGSGGVTGGNINLHYTPIHWQANEWHHVAVTYNDDNLRLYLDGQLAFEIPRYAFTSLPNPMRFSNMGGVFDEFCVFNYVLDPEDIQLIYKTDSDLDGLPDVWEYNVFGDLSVTNDPMADADSDGLANQLESELGTNGLLADTDGDNLSDFDEWNNYHTNPLLGDTDGDGLDDALEIAMGSDPLSIDTDADAIDDFMEYFLGTDLLSENTVTNIVTLAGAAASETVGQWYRSGGYIATNEERGKLTYDFSVFESNIYRIEVKGWQNNQSVNSEHGDFSQIKEVELSVDDVLLSEFSVNQAYGNDEYGRGLTMWLEAGEHSLSLLFADIINAEPFFTVESIKVQKIDGPDTDSDGIADWVVNLLEATNYIFTSSMYSYVSPAFIEGKTRFRDLMPSLSVGIPRSAPDYCWYADVPLSATEGSTSLSASFENNGLIADIEIEWLPKNIFDEGDIFIRLGDTLRLKMEDASQLEGDSSIALDGNTSDLAAGEVLDVLFDTAGSYDVTGIQGETESTLTVHVIDYVFPATVVAAKTRRLRNNAIAILPSEVYPQFDEDLGAKEDGNHYDVTPSRALDFPVIARIGDSGAVASRMEIAAFDLTYSNESHLQILEVYPDGSQLVEGVMFQKNLADTVRIRLEIFVSGVVFEDGTTVKDVTLTDFDELGRYHYRFIRGAGVGASVCHRTKLYDGNTYLGAIGE